MVPARTPATPAEPAGVVDALGQACPMPVVLLARAAEDAPVGAEITLLADDPGAKVDIPVWCRMKGHELVAAEPQPPGWRFVVRRC